MAGLAYCTSGTAPVWLSTSIPFTGFQTKGMIWLTTALTVDELERFFNVQLYIILFIYTLLTGSFPALPQR